MFGKKFKSRLFGDPPKRREPTGKQKIGKIGEDCACEYLEKNAYKIVDRNYLKKWGEIDIVARKNKKIHFVEVKSVSRDFSPVDNVIRPIRSGDTLRALATSNGINETMGSYRPEDNMHPWKLKRLGRAIQSYLLDKDIPDDVDWQFDVATVYLDMDKKLSRIFLLEDVVL